MDVCGLPKARPISCNDCPAFQRRHTSVLCAAESPTRFPWLINTTFEEKIHIRWCCIDRLSSHALPDKSTLQSQRAFDPSLWDQKGCLLGVSNSIAFSEIVYFFCGAAGGCSLVGGTMFLSRM